MTSLVVTQESRPAMMEDLFTAQLKEDMALFARDNTGDSQ